ncbi:MAG TPA: helix-turn-helix domain-containing protein [Tepidisphaeraceae bacterium]|nr:helix-turn-helix domain-containing protein [Tepidisphaeraceae bacterium]
MKTKQKDSRNSVDSYMDLIRRFPLKPIRSDDEHARASQIVSELIGRDLDTGAGDYLDTLIVLVNQYEDAHHAISEAMTPQQALRAIMEFNGLSQADIGRLVGSESAISMFLAGDRGLSKAQIKKLSERFRVDAAIFID